MRRQGTICLLLGVLTLQFAYRVDCFNPTWILATIAGPGTLSHEEMTDQACLKVAQEALLEQGFLKNESREADPDSEELIQKAFGNGASAADFEKAMETIGDANVDVDSNLPLVSAAHFDGESMMEGNARLLDLRGNVISQILLEEFHRARISAGQFLHTLQDFYSHSNWIELGHRTPNPNLGRVGRQLANIAPPNMATCRDCYSWWNPVKVGSCSKNLVVNSHLTSGYYTGKSLHIFGSSVYQTRTKPDADNLIRDDDEEGKCSHGGPFDRSSRDTANGGINKDATSTTISPHGYLHDDAIKVATAASVGFLEDVRHKVGNCLFLRFLGVYYSASLIFAIDTSPGMNSTIEKVKQAVNSIIDLRLANGTVQCEYVLVLFNDQDVGPSHVTSDSNEFKRLVGNIVVRTARNNQSHPVQALSGLLLAMEKSRPRSTVYLFVDADANDTRKYEDALTLANEKKITVNIVFSSWLRRRKRNSDLTSSVYGLITSKTGGQVLSGIQTDVVKLLTLSSTFTAVSEVTLLAVDIPVSALLQGGRNWTVTVDSMADEITVSVSGTNPKIFLFDKHDNRINVNSSNSIHLTHTAVVKVPNVAVGQLRIQVMAESSYTLRVKALSRLDLQYKFVILKEINHFGFYPIRGQPRTGSSVYIVANVVGLTDDIKIDGLFVQMENGTVTDILDVEKLNVTANQFITTDALIIPAKSFHVGLLGTELSMGTPIKRIDVTVVTPTSFELEVPSTSSVTLTQGTTSTFSFLVVNGPDSPFDTFSCVISDELNLAGKPSPSTFSLASNESRSVEVDFRVPACYRSNGLDTVTVTVTSKTTGDFNSFLLRVVVSSQFVDSQPPECILRSVVGCPFSGHSCNSGWRVTWGVLDRGSAIYNIKPISNTTTVQYNNSRTNSANQWLSVTADVPCCEDTTSITVTDYYGNKANCSATYDAAVVKCFPECRNGGLCVANNMCTCLGGYHGNLCQYVGCSSPPAPENGYVVTVSRTRSLLSGAGYSTGDNVERACNTDYQMIGSSMTTCCPFGWAGTVPQCVNSGASEGHNFMHIGVTAALVLALHILWAVMLGNE